MTAVLQDIFKIPVYCISQSPRRHFLLKTYFHEVYLISNNYQEPEFAAQYFSSPQQYVQSLAANKLDLALEINAHNLDSPARHSSEVIYLAADTCVEISGQVLGKPRDKKDAASMLENLSGKTHNVHTGMALQYRGQKQSTVVSSSVSFRKISTAEIEDYLQRADYLDKAGAYAVQEQAINFVSEIKGCFANVIGLPMAHLIESLQIMKKIR